MPAQNVRKTPRQKRSQERVNLILQATVGVLENDGIRGLSTNSIAARAKIPVSSIYQYFPNKEAILVAVYEDYLGKIRAVYEEVDSAKNLELPWREFLTLLLKNLQKAETLDNIDDELETALGLYPELMEVDRRHETWIAEHMADSLKRLGSTWPRAKLKRLAHFLYASNSMLWEYRSRHNPPRKEALDWSLTSFLAIAGQCFE